ncbi:hypothetical protein Cabys_1838 [Caldithrix abyssi DSM 13497]|uniref:Uncharacterized protein n=1 Tax=Caldithrix abyssi DSM 13497 TaxID=880073 RepID=A0A1J1C7C0_CALAY|nr:hypothetical protein Cabys_1838 [Caldithrix abyssi DSM 13497]
MFIDSYMFNFRFSAPVKYSKIPGRAFSRTARQYLSLKAP